jgi:MoaA/NifB/PqqE/SkfB family radical SAM enzyme
MTKLPKKVNFDICTFCNHKCTFCSNSDKRTLKDTVKKEDFIQVMDNVTQYLQIDEIGLSAKGEVLINKDISDIIKVCKQKYKIPYVYISSNGALLTKDVADNILKAGLDSIKFSINGIEKNEYNKTHLKDDFEIVIENFKYLIELKKTTYPNLKILISCINDNYKEIILSKFEEIFKEDFKYIDNILKYNISFTPKFKKFTFDESKLKPCPLALEEIYIDSDCRLGLCCKDYFKEFDYGSLLTNDFLDLYNSTVIKELRNMHINKSFPDNHFCKKCLLFSQEIKDEE